MSLPFSSNPNPLLYRSLRLFLLQNSAGGWVQEQRAQNSRHVWGLVGRRNERAPGRSWPFPLPMEEALAVLNVTGNDFAVWKNDSKMAARECDPQAPAKLVVIYKNAEPSCLQRHDDCDTNLRFKHAFWSIVDRNNGASSPDVFFSTRNIWRYPSWSFIFVCKLDRWCSQELFEYYFLVSLFFVFFLQRKEKRKLSDGRFLQTSVTSGLCVGC